MMENKSPPSGGIYETENSISIYLIWSLSIVYGATIVTYVIAAIIMENVTLITVSTNLL